MIRPGERLDELQPGDLHILQKEKGFRFGMDAVLLADFARVPPRATVADFGTGTGILPLLLYSRGKGSRFHAFELQEEMAEMAGRTMRINGLEQIVTVHTLSVERADQAVPPGSLDCIISNPPYGKPGGTLKNPEDSRSLARHQPEQGLDAWFAMAARLLKSKGHMAVVYPAPEMLSLMEMMARHRLEPKRFRLVYPREDKPANLVLVEAVRGARPMLHPEPPLIVYSADGRPTPELRRIYRECI